MTALKVGSEICIKTYINGIRMIWSTYLAHENRISNLTESVIRWNKTEILTTVWWLTWITSSPAWIFLQRSARDWWRGREMWPLAAATHQSYHTAEFDTTPWNIRHEYAVIKNIYTWEHKEVYTYTFCRPSDDMQTIICWFDIHALWEVNTVVSVYL